jgi:hypothetical protein
MSYDFFFKVRCRERINAIRTITQQYFKYAQHILETGHAYDTIDQTMKALNAARKGRKINTLERYHIYDLSKKSPTGE